MSMSSSRIGSSSRFGLALVAGALAFGVLPALAQQQPAAPAQGAPQAGQQGAPQGPMKVDLTPSQPNWTKVCGKDQATQKEICYTTRDFGAQKDQPPVLALAVYDVKGEEVKIVRFLMPVGLMLRPGFRFAVDKGPVAEGAYEICFPNGCFAEAKVKKDVIEAAKKGTNMAVSVKNQANSEVVFNLPLAGFGAAFDGPAIDPKISGRAAEEARRRIAEARRGRTPEDPGAAARRPRRPGCSCCSCRSRGADWQVISRKSRRPPKAPARPIQTATRGESRAFFASATGHRQKKSARAGRAGPMGCKARKP